MGQIEHKKEARKGFGSREVSLVFKNPGLEPRLLPRSCKALSSVASR